MPVCSHKLLPRKDKHFAGVLMLTSPISEHDCFVPHVGVTQTHVTVTMSLKIVPFLLPADRKALTSPHTPLPFHAHPCTAPLGIRYLTTSKYHNFQEKVCVAPLGEMINVCSFIDLVYMILGYCQSRSPQERQLHHSLMETNTPLPSLH